MASHMTLSMLGVIPIGREILRGFFGYVVAPVLRFLYSPFFPRCYLRGRYFNRSLAGWRWAWRSLWCQRILGFNRRIPWPVSPFIVISNPDNLIFDPDDLNNFQSFGCYYQNFSGKIVLGKGTWIAPNVGIITANHDSNDPDRHLDAKDVILGRSCWVGMNAVILPGVHLGDHTVVGAGAVVTRSYPEGYCVLAGVPAVPIRTVHSHLTRKPTP